MTTLKIYELSRMKECWGRTFHVHMRSWWSDSKEEPEDWRSFDALEDTEDWEDDIFTFPSREEVLEVVRETATGVKELGATHVYALIRMEYLHSVNRRPEVLLCCVTKTGRREMYDLVFEIRRRLWDKIRISDSSGNFKHLTAPISRYFWQTQQEAEDRFANDMWPTEAKELIVEEEL